MLVRKMVVKIPSRCRYRRANALFVEGGDLSLSGTLNGQLTIGTDRNIKILDNVRYAVNHYSPSFLTTTNILGLVAGEYILVGPGAPADIEVEAYLVSLQTTLVPMIYETMAGGTIEIFGGFTQRAPCPIFVSAVAAGNQIYPLDLAYDKRLASGKLFPPWFPDIRDECGAVYRKYWWTESK